MMTPKLALLAVGCLALLACVGHAQAGPWGQYRASASHEGKAVNAKGFAGFTGLAAVNWEWNLEVQHVQNPACSEASVNFQGAYFMACNEYGIVALDNSGAVLWTYEANVRPHTPLQTKSGMVVFSVVHDTSTGDDNVLIGVDTSGNKVWSFSAPANINAPLSYDIDSDTIVFGCSDHNVYAIHNGATSLLWTFPTGDEVASSAAIWQNIVYIGSNDHKLYAIDLPSGNQEWYQVLNGAINGATVVGPDGTLFVTTDSAGVVALDHNTGNMLWNFTNVGPIDQPPVVDTDYVICSDRDGVVFGLNAMDGGQAWNLTFPQRMSAPSLVEDTVYLTAGIFTGSSQVTALSREGVLQWTFMDLTKDTSGGVAVGPYGSLLIPQVGGVSELFESCPNGADNRCGGHGTCHSSTITSDRFCNCIIGWTAPDCINCSPGWFGPNCDRCPCGEHAKCDDGIGGDGSCTCTDGYTGPTCATAPPKPPSAPGFPGWASFLIVLLVLAVVAGIAVAYRRSGGSMSLPTMSMPSPPAVFRPLRKKRTDSTTDGTELKAGLVKSDSLSSASSSGGGGSGGYGTL